MKAHLFSHSKIHLFVLYLLIIVIHSKWDAASDMEDQFAGGTMYGLSLDRQIVESRHCTNVVDCYQLYHYLIININISYVGFIPNNINNCSIGHQIDDKTYVSACLTDFPDPMIVPNTTIVLNGFSQTFNVQCDNLIRHNVTLFIIAG